MSKKEHKLIIIGDSPFAEVAYEYFTYDSPYEVVAFSVEKNYLDKDSFFDLPVVPFETLEEFYSPDEHSFFVAIVYSQLNRLRTRFYQQAKLKGYKAASYISSKSFIWQNSKIGEHCFIFENNVIQPFVTIGNNVILWSGNHVGHHTVIEDNCFISSHVVLSGFTKIGKNCFLGVNSTIVDRIEIGDDCILGASTLVLKNIENDKLIKSSGSEIAAVSAKRFWKVKE